MDFDPNCLPQELVDSYSAAGVDITIIPQLFAGAAPNPITGEVGPAEVMRHIMRHLDDPLVQQMGRLMQDNLARTQASHDPDFNDFDFNSLASTIPEATANIEETIWRITLNQIGYVNTEGHFIREQDAPSTPGAKPKFFLSSESGSIIRLLEECTGLPDSITLLRFIKRTIVTPVPGIQKALPRNLLISIKFRDHAPSLAPFLNSLPAPFSWEVETAEVAQVLDDVVDNRFQLLFNKYMELANAAKVEGNDAFKRKDRATALAKYSDAVFNAKEATVQRPDVEQRKVAYSLIAVCLANRAATHLLDGEGLDANEALNDAEEAVIYDVGYAKGYYRQAKAHEALGNRESAKAAMQRALEQPGLAQDKTLLALLQQLSV